MRITMIKIAKKIIEDLPLPSLEKETVKALICSIIELPKDKQEKIKRNFLEELRGKQK